MADEPTRNINERTPERTASFDTRVVNDNIG